MRYRKFSPTVLPCELMPFENPFFVREVRASSRKAWTPLGWLVLAAALGPLLALWLVRQQQDWTGTELRGFMLTVITGYHALICSVTGWRLGTRVFGAEQQQNTLESLRLISASPWLWVLQKLVFPVYALLLVWVAAIPGALALATRSYFVPADLWVGQLLAGATGALSFGAALAIPPERVGLPRSAERGLPLAQRLELSSMRLIPVWLGWELLQLAYQWLEGIWNGGPHRFRQHLLFSLLALRHDQIIGGMLGLFLLCALSRAWNWANPSSPGARRLRVGAQISTILTAYGLLVGITWAGSFWMWQVLLVGIPAVQFFRLVREHRKLKRSGRVYRPESRFLTTEIPVVQARWDNPVLVRDLRVALRSTGLKTAFSRQWLVMLGVAAVLGVFLTSQRWVGPTYTYRVFIGALASIYGWGAFVTLLRTGMGTAVQWGTERRLKTVSQLLLSPLPGSDIVLGRWAAAMLQSCVLAGPWILCAATCGMLATDGQNPHWLFGLGAWLVSLVIVLSAGLASGIRELSHWKEWRSPAGAAIAWFLAQPFLLIKLADSAYFGGEALPILYLVFTMANALVIPILLFSGGQRVESQRTRLVE